MDKDKAVKLAYLKIVVSLCGSKDAIRAAEFLYEKEEFAYQDIQRHLGIATESLNKMLINFMKVLVIEPADLKYTSLQESGSYYRKVLDADYKTPAHDWYRTTVFFENVVKKEFPSIGDLENVYKNAVSLGDAKKSESSTS